MKYDYSAKYKYAEGSSRDEYEKLRFSGLLGKYRYRREQEAVNYFIEKLPAQVSVLDCPCGTGRWWPVLAKRASKILARDISSGMLEHAKKYAEQIKIDVGVEYGDAEALDLKDDSVDYTFSFALTKHIPRPMQYKIIQEFARVSRFGVICSFGIFSHLNYEFWRRRNLQESYPVLREELDWIAEAAGLTVGPSRKCTTPLGTEEVVFLLKK